MSNGTIQWIFKCQMGRFNGFLSVKWGVYYYMPNGAIQWILSAK